MNKSNIVVRKDVQDMIECNGSFIVENQNGKNYGNTVDFYEHDGIHDDGHVVLIILVSFLLGCLFLFG